MPTAWQVVIGSILAVLGGFVGRWLDAGGHHAQDPFVILSLIAAETRTIRLQTGILVLPYRNPFITARSAPSDSAALTTARATSPT